MSALQDALDENWRGSYDILVLADESSLLAHSGDGALLDPNFANISAPPISNEAVEQVKNLSQVSLVAPIGFLGRLWDVRDFPIVNFPTQLLQDDPVRTLRLTWTVRSDDGLGWRIADHQEFTFTIDASAWDGREVVPPGDGGIIVSGTVPVSLAVNAETVRLGFWPMPSVASTIFAVDPEAERALLGADSPRGLDRLLETDDALRGLTAQLGRPTTGEDLAPSALAGSDVPGKDALVADRSSPALTGQYGADAPIAPIIVAEDAYPPIELEVEFEVSGAGVREESVGLSEVGNVVVDVQDKLSPFAGAGFVVPWPGGAVGEITTYVQPARTTGVGPTVLAASPDRPVPNPELPAFTLVPHGFIRGIPLDTRAPQDGGEIGQTQTYRSDTPNSELRIGYATSSGLAAPLVVGTYSNTAVASSVGNAAPLGAYDAGRVTQITSSDGEMVSPIPLLPSLSGLGIVAQASTAITSLNGARSMGVEAPVTALRVRIAGVEGFTRESVEVLSETAGAVESLGLRAFIVAGSSRQTVQAWVPNYAHGSSVPGEPQEVKDLGWVELDTVALNVAQSTVTTLTAISENISAGSLAVAFAALPLLGAAQVHANRRTSKVLHLLGWGRSTQFRWFLSETLPGAVVVAAAGFVGWWWAHTAQGGSSAPWTLAGGLAAAVAVLSVCVAGASLAPRTESGPSRSGIYGWPARMRPAGNLLARRVPAALAAGVLIGLLVAAINVALVLVAAGMDATARTPLGSLLSQTHLPFLLASLLAGGFAVIVLLAAITTRHTSSTSVQADVLWRSAGWSRRRLRGLTAVELSITASACAIFVGVAVALAPGPVNPLAAFGAPVAAAVLIGTSIVPLGCVAVARIIPEERSFSRESWGVQS